MKPVSSKKGFTLIELLVVIAIIGLLSGVVLASLNTARAKSRDAKRMADIRQIQSAIELYANDNNGSYPSTSSQWWGNCSGFGSRGVTGSNGYVPNLAPTYIGTLPLDPNPSSGACYLYRSDGADYMLLVYKTVETYTQATNPMLRPSAPAELNFALYTPGARLW